MGPTSKDLLSLEREKSSSCLESTLLVCKKESLSKTSKPHHTNEKLATTSVPKSEVLGKVKDFLGVMEEANKRLRLDAQEKSQNDHDIEVLTGNETELIEMDLLLGVADLHTPEALAAAESAMTSSQSACLLAGGGSGSYLSCSDDDSDSGDDDDDNDDNKNESCLSDKFQKPKMDPDHSQDNKKAKKRPRIIELQ
ncbi:unconventional prefoldin RPB5 interactor 1-like [Macadamia integrifolia]|uniref:unconventional prefoldin RPB5 interactor 1-like n=1 Tax=Macadamia integrifolia TaxID=60698 RepID=UPI001C500E71|nr:unconventional prefoldin RPB5 interactor 1-like [Macadamia integrifolia]XP_042508012.1 unconventional prefoldin RPB5 interactor 1-like [Macadamia integrifolia]